MKHTSYTDLYGVDMTGAARGGHAAHMVNLYRREGTEAGVEGGALTTLPGFRRLGTYSAAIYTLMPDPDGAHLYIHAGRRLYRMSTASLPPLPHGADLEAVLAMLAATRQMTPLEQALPLAAETVSGVSAPLYAYLPLRQLPFAVLGEDIYLLCQEEGRLLRLHEGEVTVVAEAARALIDGYRVTALTPPYIPLLSRDGVPLQQRNLLTDAFRESRLMTAANLSLAGNAPLTFRVNDPAAEVPTCTVTGLLPYPYTGPLVIPAATEIDGVTCTVTAIDSAALAGGSFTEIYFPYTMRKLGAAALRGCRQVHTVHIPVGITEIYMSVFNECADSLLVRYEGTAAQWEGLTVYEDTYIHSYDLRAASYLPRVTYGVPLSLPARSLDYCKLGERFLGSNLATDPIHMVPLRQTETAPYTHLLLIMSTRFDMEGQQLTLLGRADPFTYGQDSPLYADGAQGYTLPLSAHCLCAHDHRLFFGGGRVADALFYTGTDEEGNPAPAYIGIYNYELEGTRLPLTQLCEGDGDLLACHGDGTRGKLLARRGALPDGEDRAMFPRVYPVAAECDTKYKTDMAFMYGDRLHLLSAAGLFSYTRRTDGGYLRAASAATRIAPALAAADRRGHVGRLAGRLALYPGDRLLYVGDQNGASDSGRDYEWYPAEGIGSHRGDAPHEFPVDRMPAELAGLYVCPYNMEHIKLTAPDTAELTQQWVSALPLFRMEGQTPVATGESCRVIVYSDRLGETVCVPADCNGEYTGGSFSALTAMANVGELLFFGTAEGALCLFNTDDGCEAAEGVPPDSRYLQDGHRQNCALTTFPFDCGAPARLKRTVGGSVFCLLGEDSRLSCRCLADGQEVFCGKLSRQGFDLTALDFTALCFCPITPPHCPLPEGTLTFREKSYAFFSDRPFTLTGIGFSWRLLPL